MEIGDAEERRTTFACDGRGLRTATAAEVGTALTPTTLDDDTVGNRTGVRAADDNPTRYVHDRLNRRTAPPTP